MPNKIFYCFVCLFFLSCKKWETSAPVINIVSPIIADTVFMQDSIFLHFNIKDKNLQSYKIILFNQYTKKIWYKEEANVTSADFNFSKKIFFELQADTTAYVNVLGIDKNGNTGVAGHAFYLKK